MTLDSSSIQAAFTSTGHIMGGVGLSRNNLVTATLAVLALLEQTNSEATQTFVTSFQLSCLTLLNYQLHGSPHFGVNCETKSNRKYINEMSGLFGATQKG